MVIKKPSCFKWFGSKKPKIIILGTFPGNKSLLKSEYYADTTNRFWMILGKCLQEKLLNTSYDLKQKILVKHKIAINDVFCSVERNGSCDKNIVKYKIDEKVLQNIISWKNHKPFIYFNGSSKKSKKLFSEFTKELIKNGIDWFDYLYSTSRMGVDNQTLLNNWQNKLK